MRLNTLHHLEPFRFVRRLRLQLELRHPPEGGCYVDLETALAAVALAAALLIASGDANTLAAQGRPKADITVVADADGVHAGRTARVALRVALPEGVHVQSNAPRDPLLIATSVTATPPPGITVTDVVYPKATDFVQAGQSTPLSVFDQRFAIGIALAVSGDLAPGEAAVPIRLRYQACDATTCFAPLREELTATLRIVTPETKPAARFTDLFAALPFRR